MKLKRSLCAILCTTLILVPVNKPMSDWTAGAPVQGTQAETTKNFVKVSAPRPAGENTKVSGQLVVKLQPGVDPDKLAAGQGAQILRRNRLNYVTMSFAPGTGMEAAAAKLRQISGVLGVEPNRLVTGAGTTVKVSDPQYSSQWALAQAGVPQAWALGATGSGITIAVVDSGVDLNHPDLKENLVPGYNAIEPNKTAQDDNGHGTHVAGIAAAGLNGVGVVGVAYQAKIMPVKVMDSNGQGPTDIIADGVIWAVDHGAKIINISLGSDTNPSILVDAIQYAQTKGALVVAAAGNYNPASESDPGLFYPAADPGVLAVTATDSNDKVANFSATGPQADLSAPGVHILSDYWGSGGSTYGYGSGTSMAAPLVSGVAALVWSQHPDWDPRKVRITLENAAKVMDAAGRDNAYGFGRVDAFLAVSSASAQAALTSPANVAPSGGIVQTGDSSFSGSLTVPPGAFSQNQSISLEAISSPGDLPAGVTPLGPALSLQWSGDNRSVLGIAVKAASVSSGQPGYLYRWSGSRWIPVGGGLSGSSISAGVYEPGIYRAGIAPLSADSRLAGTDRLQTAIRISQSEYPFGSDSVILARADDFPDALAGAPLAYKLQAPILLTYPDSLSQDVLGEITRLAPKRIIILGGTGAVSSGIADLLGALAPVTRISGADRYATSAAIARSLNNTGTAALVNGDNFPDALSIAAVAARRGMPILLTPSKSLAPAVDQVLRELRVTDTLVVGGDGAVSPGVFQLLTNPLRIAGPDRYRTAAAVLQAFPPPGMALYAATGEDFPDALAGGPLAAMQGSMVLIIPRDGLTPFEAGSLQGFTGRKGVALGGTGVLTDAALAGLQTAIQ